MQVLVVIAGTGVLCPRLRCVDVDVAVIEQRLGQCQDAGMHGQQADLGAGEGKRVDASELVADEPVPARVGAVVEAVSGREHQVQFRHCRHQFLGRDEPREDRVTVIVPGLYGIVELHQAMMISLDAEGQSLSRAKRLRFAEENSSAEIKESELTLLSPPSTKLPSKIGARQVRRKAPAMVTSAIRWLRWRPGCPAWRPGGTARSRRAGRARPR